MKFFAALLIAAAVMLVFVVRTVHADAVPTPTRPAPTLAAGPWLNGPETTLAAQKGKVVVLLFWTRDCINCKHNLGYWNDWAQKYRGTDVTVLSVHTPETRFERSPDTTTRFARERGLRFPIIVDNDAHLWKAYGIESWPTEILIDKQGRIRAEYAGELNWEGNREYKTVQAQIEKLRHEQVASR